jgi:hypothetical protein
LDENTLPLWRWQWVQWQTAVMAGSAFNSYRTAPHRQPPLRSVIIASLEFP